MHIFVALGDFVWTVATERKNACTASLQQCAYVYAQKLWTVETHKCTFAWTVATDDGSWQILVPKFQ